MRILMAEDDMNISTIAKLTLEQMGGHEVVVVHDGEAALRLALSEAFDVILLDEMMPRLNGLKVCEEYQRQSSSSSPVIFLSAKSQSSDINEFLRLGVGYIAKPFDPLELNRLIRQILSKANKDAA